jgi:hypothetical protein
MTVIWESREGEKDGREVEDRVRKVGVRRRIVHARVDPAWANSGHPSPLPVPLRARLSGSSMSGTARVPAPQRKSRAIRRVRESPRCRVSASASANLLSTLAQQTGHPPEFSSSLYTYPLPPVKPQGVSFPTVLTLTIRSGSLRCPFPCSPHPAPPPSRRGGGWAPRTRSVPNDISPSPIEAEGIC